VQRRLTDMLTEITLGLSAVMNVARIKVCFVYPVVCLPVCPNGLGRIVYYESLPQDKASDEEEVPPELISLIKRNSCGMLEYLISNCPYMPLSLHHRQVIGHCA
jgi:hypothetical protein